MRGKDKSRRKKEKVDARTINKWIEYERRKRKLRRRDEKREWRREKRSDKR